MKRGSTLFLQIVIVLIGIGVLALMLVEPRIEGRNANATLFQIYFNDPFLAYAYTASIAFFVALYQASKVLGRIRRDKAFSQATVKAAGIIRYCAIIIIGFVVIGVIFIRFFSGSDDPAGGVFMGFLITFASLVIAAVVDVLERLLQSGIDIKSKDGQMV